MNKYFIKARLYPTLVTILPVLMLYYFSLGTQLNNALSDMIAIPVILHVTISGSLIYGLTLLNRFIAKEIFQRLYFKDEQRMPSTTMLLNQDNSLSKDMKEKVRNRIASDFYIQLMGAHDEQQDESEARKQIAFAVSQIRNRTRGNSLLLQHNIEYGFIRNFVGGSFIAILVCVADIIIFRSVYPVDLAYKASIALLAFYLLIILISKFIISRHGKNYAKVLFEQFLST